MIATDYLGWVNTSYIPQTTIERLRDSALFPHVRRYVAEREAAGYTANYTRDHVVLFTYLSTWMQKTRRTVRDLNETIMERFFRRPLRGSPWCGGLPALCRLLTILREAGMAAPAPVIQRTPIQELLEEFHRYLEKDRGCVSRTGIKYTYYLRPILADRFGTGPAKVCELTTREMSMWILRSARERTRGHTQKVVTALRAFFRYLLYRGLIATDLAVAVPNVACWRLTSLPKPLAPDAVKRVLVACPQTTANDRRNYAILLLLARLGLRGGEIMVMQLEDIDWENARLTVRSRKGQGPQRMPLPSDVGRAIARYLRVRPTCGCRNVFVRSKAPYRPLVNSSAISFVACEAIKRAGVVAAHTGAHIFRHSLAAAMLRGGASLDEIGQVLRHSNRDTTSSYAKVDLGALRPLALAWPGGAQ